MTRIADRFRSILGPLVVLVAVVAIMVPTCQMVGCNGMMVMPHFGDGLAFSGRCSGTMVLSAAPTAVLPDSSTSLLLTLSAAVVAVAVALRPHVAIQPVRIVDATPPPPPEDPLGERFRV